MMNPSMLEISPPHRVTVIARDYSYEGWLVGVVIKRSGTIRYVLEDDNGRLFIHNEKQIGHSEGWLP